ncbi:conjugative transposon protein TraM [Flavobacterium sp. ASW18X]|uniref:conjugative transposon protein TraM n=1 Tax=Flavobacterium sp. ASW18X TaxID=2572595 RepID=UPI0010AE8070|nr:conjugative transposon protein TraM [Flavobacterium sp. ASW18X]TKD59010.1 conjugative transposon protein TraM [Flavobacterium sp. ASW18X]
MKNLTEHQKKLYLVIAMTVLGGGLLLWLQSFKGNDIQENTKEEAIQDKARDFTITLDTLNKTDRKAFYEKERKRDTLIVSDPFNTDKEESKAQRILDMTKLLEEEEKKQPVKKNTVRISTDESLWDMGKEQNSDNLKLSTSGETALTEAERRAQILEANKKQRELYLGGGDNQMSQPMALSVKAAVYRDQFILPGDQVELIITEDFNYKEKLVPKNTIVYAIASINQNRVLLQINNINHVSIALKAKDITDGLEGIRSKRAGELWAEASNDVQEDVMRDVSIEATRETGRIGRSIGRSISQLFRRKNYKQKDKILLVNDHQVVLTNIK